MTKKETSYLTVRNGRLMVTKAGSEFKVRVHDDNTNEPVRLFDTADRPLTGRRILLISAANEGVGHIWIGGSDVNATDKGYRISNEANDDDNPIYLDVSDDVDIWYIIAANIEVPATLEVK